MAGIYVHIPFCSQACYYCDFHFSTSLNTKERVIKAMIQDILNQKKYLKKELINTIYFGGGTPSLIDVKSLDQIYNTIQNNFQVAEDVEFTIEANPEDITKHKVNEWITLGVNRVSLGAQSFREKDLQYMNRIHTNKQIIDAISVLKKSIIDNISIDLIYGFPLLTDKCWKNNLQKVISFDIPHISCYCLTVENNTPLFFLIKNGKYGSLSTQQGKEHFVIARELLCQNGYNHYEISNFSKPNYESQHNRNYWNQTKYLGIGPSAHSFNGISRRWNIKNNIMYCKNIERNLTYSTEELLTRKNVINEHILTSLRTSLGINSNYLKRKMGPNEWNSFSVKIEKLEKENMLRIGKKIYLTEKGMLFSDGISEKLFLI